MARRKNDGEPRLDPERDEPLPYGVEPPPRPETPGDPPQGAGGESEEGLLSGFDEDDDFEHDPEVQATLEGKGRADRRAAPVKPDPAGEELPSIAEWFVLPGLGGWRSVTVVGVLFALLASVLSSYGHESRPLTQAIYTLYEVALHTGTGVLAVVLAARFSERRVNQPELAAARMLVAVSVLCVFFYAQTPLYPVVQYPLAVGAYMICIWQLFRLPRYELMLLAGLHFVLWLIVRIGGELETALATSVEING